MRSFYSLSRILVLASVLPLSATAWATGNDLSLSGLVLERANYAVGEVVTMQYKVSNVGTETAEQFVISYQVNGVTVAEQTIDQRLLPGRDITLTGQTPTGVAEQTLGVEVKVEVSSVNGGNDDNVSNNAQSEVINVYNTLFDRNVVIEEGTGTWCGWCVRGIVAMEKMKEEHPNDFIGIAVHSNDKMTVSEYAEAQGLKSLPGCDLNREYRELSVDSTQFETYYQFAKMQKAIGRVSVCAEWIGEDSLDVTTSSEFCYSGDGAWSMAIVLVEDSVTGYYQQNYYAGGESGEMRGFEDLPKVTAVDYNDVARGIYPAYGGEVFVEGEVIEGQTYCYEYALTLPAEVQRKSKLSVVALLIDTTTGNIVNAARLSLGGSATDDEGDTDPADPSDPTDPSDPSNPGEDTKPVTGDYAYVDLGLSVMWSSGNMLGADQEFGQASAIEDCGGYFGWADPTGQLTEADDSLYPSGSLPTEISGTALDIARQKWGGNWRLPTHVEFVELYNNCTFAIDSINGVAGGRFTSVINGQSIFLPLNGDRYGEDVWGVGEYGSYWSGTLYDQEMDGIWYAYELDFDGWGVNINNVASRYSGMAVRPVISRTAVQLGNTTEARNVLAVKYFAPDGTLLASPRSGICIERTYYSDGHIAVRKVCF